MLHVHPDQSRERVLIDFVVTVVRAEHVLGHLLHLREREDPEAVRRSLDAALRGEELEKAEAVRDRLRLAHGFDVHRFHDGEERGRLLRGKPAGARVSVNTRRKLEVSEEKDAAGEKKMSEREGEESIVRAAVTARGNSR